MKITPFADIYQRAVERKGGEDSLRGMLTTGIKTAPALARIGDDRYLAAMTKCVFRSGFVWKVIDNKWPGFEAAFWKFNVLRCAMMSHEDIDALCEDERIVRNGQKINTVPANAAMILDAQKTHGSFAKLIAHWQQTDLVGLLEHLKKHGARLGGNTGQYFLRAMGRDCFVLSRDGVAALTGAGVIDKSPTGKAAMAKVQHAYNQWHEESGLGYAAMSRVLALSIDS